MKHGEDIREFFDGSRDFSSSIPKVALPKRVKAAPQIKNTPAFDPDADVSSLTLTIPMWLNTINRTRNKANLKLISDDAATALIEKIEDLTETANKLKNAIKEAKNES